MSNEHEQWSTRYRPKLLKEVVGQTTAVAYVRGMMERGSAPNCILVSGPSGCGKTTLARIVAAKLSGWKGDPDKNPDKIELSANVDRSIDDVRKSIQQSRYHPQLGRRRVMLVDEAHGYVGPAASAMLKAVEDPAPKTTWILCSDQPWKLPKQMLGRATNVAVQALDEKALVADLSRICAAEKVNFGKKHDVALQQLAKYAHGTARTAVNLLEHAWTTVQGGGSVSEAIKGAISSDAGAEAFDSAVNFLKATIKGDPKAAAFAIASSTAPDGILDLANMMLIALIRRAAGGQPNSGVGWAAIRAFKETGDLNDLLTLQARFVAAVDMKGRYQVPVESIMYGLARR